MFRRSCAKLQAKHDGSYALTTSVLEEHSIAQAIKMWTNMSIAFLPAP